MVKVNKGEMIVYIIISIRKQTQFNILHYTCKAMTNYIAISSIQIFITIWNGAMHTTIVVFLRAVYTN